MKSKNHYMSNNIRDLLTKIRLDILLKLVRTWKNRPVYNVFNDDFDKTVLISYVARPFRQSEENWSHTMYTEAKVIACAFRKIGYNVDVVNYNYNGSIDIKKYSLVFGFGDVVEKSIRQNWSEALIVFYGTGMHVSIQNSNTLYRVNEVLDKKGLLLLDSARIVDKTWSIQTSINDGMIVLGNQEVVKSYEKYYKGIIQCVPVSYYEVLCESLVESIIEHKDYTKAKYNFLWFGGSGLIHKGLDIVLEYFSQNKEYTLHICGPIDSEPGFKKAYNYELYNLPNIHTYGFLDINSDLYKSIIKQCLFVVFPSCSEGGAASVVNVMANGLIPVVTKEAGVSINNFGFEVKGLDVVEFGNAISTALNTSIPLLRKRSYDCFKHTRKYNSIESFQNIFESSLNKIINRQRKL